MRLFNYSLGVFALVTLLSFALINVKGHAPRKVELMLSDYPGRPLQNAIRVYPGPSLKDYAQYSILSDTFEFEILDKHSYAIGIFKNVNVTQLKVDSVSVDLKRKRGDFKIARIAKGDKHIFPNNLFLSKMVASSLIGLYCSFFFWALGKLFQSERSAKKLLASIGTYALALAPLIFYASIFSPALYDFDFPDSLIHAFRYGLSGWFSFINYIFLGAGNIIGKLTGLGIKAHMMIQVSVFFCAICFYLDLLRRSKAPRPSMPFVLGILWLPPFVLFSLQVSRDFWTTLLPIISAIGLIYLKFERKKNFSVSVLLSLAMGLACLYRPELILGAIILIFGISWTQNKASALASFAIIFTMLFAGLFINNKIDPRASRIKLMASLSHPMGAVLASDSPNISAVERKKLAQYIDVPLLKAKHVDFEIMGFHSGAVRIENVLKEMDSFLKLNLSIFLKNPWVVLKSRIIMFARLTGITGATSGHPDDHNYHLNLKNKNLVGLLDWDVLNKNSSNFRAKIINAQHSWLAWFYNMLPSLLICVWAMKTYRKNSVCALAAALVLSKIPIFFLLAPAAHFKYAWDLYAIGLILWPLVIAERKRFFRPLSL